MSIFAIPRIHFRGGISWDTTTANHPHGSYFDRASGAVRPPAGVTHDTFKTYLMGTEAGQIRSFHNYYGDNSCLLTPDTRIVEGTLANGNRITKDPVIGKSVGLFGESDHAGVQLPCRIVDVDPYSGWSSQLYFNRLVVGDDSIGFHGGRNGRTIFHWYDPTRNFNVSGDLQLAGIAAATWQLTLRADDVEFSGTANSRLLADFDDAIQTMPNVRGLVVRFCTYMTLYFQNAHYAPNDPAPSNDAELSRAYLRGAVFANPCYSRVVGTIALWMDDEPATVPAGRYLVPETPVMPLNVREDGTAIDGVRLGPATFDFDEARRLLTIDLLATIPEWDSSGLKANFGDLIVKSASPDGKVVEIGRIPYGSYDHVQYERRGGVVDLAISKHHVAAVKDGVLSVDVERSGRLGVPEAVTVLREQPLTAFVDDRAVYLDEATSGHSTVRVLHHGRHPQFPTRVRIAQYESDHRRWVWSLVDDANRYVEVLPGDVVDVAEPGAVDVTLKAVRPGCCVIVLLPAAAGDPDPVPPVVSDPSILIDIIRHHFVLPVRVLPFDNALAATQDAELTWDFIYEHIVQPFDLMHPATTSVRHPFSLDNYAAMKRHSRHLVARTDPALFMSTLYMPVTRDFSAGKRKLLVRWCDLGCPE